ncbi:MAG: hypothetical protein JWM52_245 [Candidatus Saccharibacteria bacterium]|nr:hypothetical protein [Candidatus Saccharibacteria bacterium]
MTTPSDVFTMPPQAGNQTPGPASDSSEHQQVTPDLLRGDRQALIDEATQLALASYAGGGFDTPLYFRTVELMNVKKQMESFPEVTEIRRFIQSMTIMQDKHIQRTQNQMTLNMLSNLISRLRLKNNEPLDVEKMRHVFINEEWKLSEQIFEENTQKPPTDVWRMHQLDGHIYRTFAHIQTPEQPTRVVHYTISDEGVYKSISETGRPELKHLPVIGEELTSLLNAIKHYENLMAQEMYLKQSRHDTNQQ